MSESCFTIECVKRVNKSHGYHFFDRDAMRFFDSRISGPVIAGMFVSSERFNDEAPRRYTIRRLMPTGHIDNVSEFQAYGSKAAALADIRRIAAEWPVCAACNDVYDPNAMIDGPSGLCAACATREN